MFFSQVWALITWTEASSLPDQLGRVAAGGASVPVYLLWTLLLVGGLLRWLQGLKERTSPRTPRESSQAGGSKAASADQADPEPPNGAVADEAAPRGAGVGPIQLKDPTFSSTLPNSTPGISAGSTTQTNQSMSSPDPERHETLELKKPSEYSSMANSTQESDTSPEVRINSVKPSATLPSKRQSRVAKMVRCQGSMCRKISEED